MHIKSVYLTQHNEVIVRNEKEFDAAWEKLLQEGWKYHCSGATFRKTQEAAPTIVYMSIEYC